MANFRWVYKNCSFAWIKTFKLSGSSDVTYQLFKEEGSYEWKFFGEYPVHATAFG